MRITKAEQNFLYRLYCEIRDEPTVESIEKKKAFFDSLPKDVQNYLIDEMACLLPEKLDRFERLVAESLDT